MRSEKFSSYPVMVVASVGGRHDRAWENLSLFSRSLQDGSMTETNGPSSCCCCCCYCQLWKDSCAHIDALLLSRGATDNSSSSCFYFCFHSRHASSWSPLKSSPSIFFSISLSLSFLCLCAYCVHAYASGCVGYATNDENSVHRILT